MKKYTHVTQVVFDQAKLLQGAGLTLAQAAKITGRSTFTIQMIYKANTLEEYRALVRSYSGKYAEKYRKAKSYVPEDVFPKTHSDLPESKESLHTYSYDDSANLERIAVALERLVEIAKNKKRLF